MAITNITDLTFDKAVEKGTVLVDFWAPWCGPCKMIAPVLEELDAEIGNKISITKLNVDENPDSTSRFGVMGIPALLVFKNGERVDQVSGFRPKDQLLQLLQKHM